MQDDHGTDQKNSQKSDQKDDRSNDQTNDALIGKLVGGKFLVRRLIGAGGMGAVYEAEQQPLGRKVALKVIKRALTDEAMATKRFINEARAVAQLNHKNIVTIHDFGAVDGGDPSAAGGGLYIAMEFLDGHDLRDEILHAQRVPWRRASRIVAEVALALAEAHTRGIVHRDLKPDNVMLLELPAAPSPSGAERAPQIKVVDFGVAKLLPEHGGTAGMTGTGMVVGTPGYISPEQINGINDDPRSDLYALGVIWYEMLLGMSPYDGATPVKLVLEHLTSPVPPLVGVVPGLEIPDGVESLVRRLLAKEPSDRPENAIVLVNEVERLLAQDDGLAPDMPTEGVNVDEVGVAAANVAAAEIAAASAAVASEKPRSAASFPRPESAPVSEQESNAAAEVALTTAGLTTANPGHVSAKPGLATPATASQMPVPQVKSPPSPAIAAKQRGFLQSMVLGCFGLTALVLLGIVSIVTLAIVFGDAKQKNSNEINWNDGDEDGDGDDYIDGDAQTIGIDAQRGGKRNRPLREIYISDKHVKTSKRAGGKRENNSVVVATKGEVRSFRIKHPPEGREPLALDAFQAAFKRKPKKATRALKKLLQKRGIEQTVETLARYFDYNDERISPRNKAYDDFVAASELLTGLLAAAIADCALNGEMAGFETGDCTSSKPAVPPRPPQRRSRGSAP